ncbi:Natural cytotoxicity triggering receptor 3 ligand 1 [Acipenser ruthenus]|uniref:Natural cytotoxicity triggering receptor 3 ligand 1 n=1 Tax=Acipenser ruthenus TaxID=7906 RepID=A0A444UZW0_ACIRT|nr:Natural cytotoxicity triggering receptor 3 ligand 1 [Acipenser ruthenus]
MLKALAEVHPAQPTPAPPVVQAGVATQDSMSLAASGTPEELEEPQLKAPEDHPEKKANSTKELAIENSTHISIFEGVDFFTSFLTLRNVTPYDGGVYQCSVYVVIPSAKDYRGNGTLLSVKAAPVVSLTAGSVDDRSGLVTLTCSVMGFYPQDVTVSWENTPIGIPPSIQQHPLTLNQDGTYSTSSSVTLWSPETDMTCTVNQSSLAEPIRKNIGKGGGRRLL